MGSSCSRRKRKLESALHRARKKYTLRNKAASPCPGPLVLCCIDSLARNPNQLAECDLDALGSGLCTELLEGLVRSGVLDTNLAVRFADCALWKVSLASYPGVTNRVCNLLAHQGHLTTLDVSSTQVDDSFIDVLARNRGLQSVNLSQTAVSNKGLLVLCKNAPQITSLVVDGCTNLHGYIPGLVALSSLEKLSLCGCRHVSAAHVIGSISAATRVTYLNLSWCMGSHCSSADPTRALVGFHALRELLLDHTYLEEPAATLNAVVGLKCLTQLSMSGFPFPACDDHSFFASDNCLDGSEEQDGHSESGLATIRASWPGGEPMQLTSDVTAHVPVVGIASYRTKRILSIGQGTARLTMLTLRSSSLSPRAWQLVAGLASLEHLDASFTNLCNSTLQTLGRLSKLTCLDLDSTSVSDQGMTAVGRLNSLQNLCLADTRLENAGVECLCGLRKLRALSLAYTNITDPAIANLSELQGLTYLSVDSRLITDYGLQHLRSLSNLVALDVFGCKMSKVGAASVAHLKSLRWLESAGGCLDNDAVRELTPLAATLTYLSLAQNKMVTDRAWGSLAKFHALRQLNLSHTGTSVPSIAAVAQLSALQQLSMHGVRGTQIQADLLTEEFPQLNVSCRELNPG